LLAAAGGTLASVALFSAPSLLSRLFDLPIPVEVQEALKPDFSMIVICIALCLLSSLVFGFLPAIRFSSASVSLQTEAKAARALARVQATGVGDGYLNTMGIPLLSGRDFSGIDSAGSDKVTIITKRLAERLFPDAGFAEAIGRRLTFLAAEASGAETSPADSAADTTPQNADDHWRQIHSGPSLAYGEPDADHGR
jgi:hypothetical protein